MSRPPCAFVFVVVCSLFFFFNILPLSVLFPFSFMGFSIPDSSKIEKNWLESNKISMRFFFGLSPKKPDWPESNWPKSNWPMSHGPFSKKPVGLSRIGLGSNAPSGFRLPVASCRLPVARFEVFRFSGFQVFRFSGVQVFRFLRFSGFQDFRLHVADFKFQV